MKIFNKSKQNYGLTFIEVIIVIVIMGIIASVAIPSLSITRGKAKTTARQIVMDLRLARSMAITESNNYIVKFSSSGYKVFKEGNEANPVKTIKFATQITSSGTTEFKFQPFGNSISGGTVNVAENGTNKYTITVISTTGRAYETCL